MPKNPEPVDASRSPESPRPPEEPQGTMPRVAICTGKSCRKSQGLAELEAALADSCSVVRTACLGECKGPVVVANFESEEAVVLRRLRKRKQRAALLAFLFGAPLSQRLEQRRLEGRKREKAISKARRSA
ncbi:hypothetical protein Poly30_10650 [Planctomycetes bacterium Poly30]|uniref:(2Fe-2S) ferredoxin domain-containing protein n=1 Tax=Saltatorellus ferox TaxID=2528018 RepID=A0A518ENA3_9BACT|nr:hypothetical protein Poly30_10650 [Planctomycetes bacterium Poly30]